MRVFLAFTLLASALFAQERAVVVTKCCDSTVEPTVSVVRFDIAARASAGIPVYLPSGDHIEFIVRPSSPNVTSIRIEGEIQVDGRLVTYSHSADTNGANPMFVVPVSSAMRAVIGKPRVTERIDRSTTEVEVQQ